MRRSQWIAGGCCLCLMALTVSAGGCVGMTAQLLYALGQHQTPAEFDGLKGKRVAVVCVANTSNYDPSSPAASLAKTVAEILKLKVDGIEIISQEKVHNWIDNKNWDQMNYRDVGSGVNAQMLVAIDLNGYRLHEDQTLFKGHADVTITVYDMTKYDSDNKERGVEVFRRSKPNFAFPVNTHEPAINTNELEFQRKFIFVLANNIAKHFYVHEASDDYALDATILK